MDCFCNVWPGVLVRSHCKGKLSTLPVACVTELKAHRPPERSTPRLGRSCQQRSCVDNCSSFIVPGAPLTGSLSRCPRRSASCSANAAPTTRLPLSARSSQPGTRETPSSRGRTCTRCAWSRSTPRSCPRSCPRRFWASRSGCACGVTHACATAPGSPSGSRGSTARSSRTGASRRGARRRLR